MRRTGFEGPERVRRDKRALDSKENEVEMPVLKDTEASLDIGCEKYAAPERCLQGLGLSYRPHGWDIGLNTYLARSGWRNLNSLRMTLNIVVMLWDWESSPQLN
ncbi:hypothetical protein TNCV_165042 [Trichonephila clavipes]|nr:hypothetical protein TNCV_165042 [Trichonephila clavipes]